MSKSVVTPRPFPPWPVFAEEEIFAATAVLRSGKVNYWTGDEVIQFEGEFADYVGTQYAVALANGTVALEAALMALGIGPGDDVIVPCRTFIASASCVVLRGARPIVADVDPVSQTLTAESVKAALTPRARALIVVHLAGWPCDMEPILALAKERGLWVVEDCAQAHGATYKKRQVGALADLATFSFCHDKIMTTAGEGGMVTTNDRDLWSNIWAYKDHGKSYEAVSREECSPGFRWLHESFGTNWRMTEVQAAIGRVQLRKLPEWLRLRRRNAGILDQRFAVNPALRVTVPPTGVGHAYYKYYTFLRLEVLCSGWDRDRVVEALTAEGILCGSGSCSELYLEKAFDGQDFRPTGRLKVAKELGQTSLMFPVHPTLLESDMHRMADAVEKVLNNAIR